MEFKEAFDIVAKQLREDEGYFTLHGKQILLWHFKTPYHGRAINFPNCISCQTMPPKDLLIC